MAGIVPGRRKFTDKFVKSMRPAPPGKHVEQMPCFGIRVSRPLFNPRLDSILCTFYYNKCSCRAAASICASAKVLRRCRNRLPLLTGIDVEADEGIFEG
jgi:hypothetical protein